MARLPWGGNTEPKQTSPTSCSTECVRCAEGGRHQQSEEDGACRRAHAGACSAALHGAFVDSSSSRHPPAHLWLDVGPLERLGKHGHHLRRRTGAGAEQSPGAHGHRMLEGAGACSCAYSHQVISKCVLEAALASPATGSRTRVGTAAQAGGEQAGKLAGYLECGPAAARTQGRGDARAARERRAPAVGGAHGGHDDDVVGAPLVAGGAALPRGRRLGRLGGGLREEGVSGRRRSGRG